MKEADPRGFGPQYSNLTDDELLSLAEEARSLTPQALQELESELRHRNIDEDRRDESRNKRAVSQARMRKRAALRRRRWLEDLCTSHPFFLGAGFGALGWYIARTFFGVPASSARVLGGGIGLAVAVVSAVFGVIILDARQKWRKAKSHRADRKSTSAEES
jgi:hypothetical protein